MVALQFYLGGFVPGSVGLSFISSVRGSRGDLKLPPIVWAAPIGCDFSGFFVEVLSYMIGLADAVPPRRIFFKLGDCSEAFLSSLGEKEASILRTLQRDFKEVNPLPKDVVWIFHKQSEHTFPEFFRTMDPEIRPKLAIGRMMTETEIVPQKDVEYALQADDVWVPSDFHRDAFAKAGVPASKLFVLPEAVDCDFFSETTPKAESRTRFRFVSVFKYEHRKGGDVLLRAYWSEFTKMDDVELIIRSYKPGWAGGKTLAEEFNEIAHVNFGKGANDLARVTLIENAMSKSELRQLYQRSNIFVLPTRGEGWCLPAAEAMASGIPAIATNFSGLTQFIKESISYPLPVLRMNADGTAEPDEKSLRRIMRSVFANPAEVLQKGRRAQRYVTSKFHPHELAKRILQRIAFLLRLKEKNIMNI